jgi:protein arginine kinase activator
MVMADKSKDKRSSSHEPERLPDRPIECGECKKPICVHYTEMFDKMNIQTSMCHECPELRKRLHGLPSTTDHGQSGYEAELACGNCGTTLEVLRTGNPLGCSVCYEVFDDSIIHELFAAQRIPARIVSAKRSSPVHIGRIPGETHEINPTMRLLALNEALNETLKREDYEQAAWLRDQIKALTNENGEKDESK